MPSDRSIMICWEPFILSACCSRANLELIASCKELIDRAIVFQLYVLVVFDTGVLHDSVLLRVNST